MSRSPRCPLCGNPPGDAVFGGAEEGGSYFSILYCVDCAVGTTYPAPSADELAARYGEGAYRAGDGTRFTRFVESLIAISRAGRRMRIEKRVPRGAILDIGTGRGLFLNLMKAGGWRVAGVEFDDRTADGARTRYGIDVRTGEVGRWEFPAGSFDVVTMCHSLEHMPNPAETVDECRRLLRDGGLFAVAVPNLGSLQASVGKCAWFHLDPAHHLHHFSEEGLIRLLRGRFFDIVAIRRFDLEHDPYGWLQTLLNLTRIRKNLLFDLLKRPGVRPKDAGSAPVTDKIATFALMPVYVPLAVLLSLVESYFLKRPGTVEVYAVKR